MILTGIADEAGASIDTQIRATRELGWNCIEARTVRIDGHPEANLHDIDEEAFDRLAERLSASGITVYALGSTIANWGKRIEDPFDLSDVERAIPRMQRLGTRYVRIMSYAVSPGPEQHEAERFRRVREIVRRFLDAGLVPLHENCMNYGGMSWRHALRLLENVPGLRWVFDTANPVFNDDRSKPEPHPKQDPWEFWTHVRDHVDHIHIKDAVWVPERNNARYTLPGEGDGAVRRILSDALSRGYDKAVSIEPHTALVFHDDSVDVPEQEAYDAYILYGRRFIELLDGILAENASPTAGA